MVRALTRPRTGAPVIAFILLAASLAGCATDSADPPDDDVHAREWRFVTELHTSNAGAYAAWANGRDEETSVFAARGAPAGSA